MTEVIHSDANPTVAQRDQSKQEAIDALRRADSFLLFVLDDEAEQVEAFLIATFMQLMECAATFREIMREQTAALVDAVYEGDETE
jgi:hypothetical protein